MPATHARHATRELRQAVADGLAAIPAADGARAKQPPARRLLECLNDREADVLPFLSDTRV